MAPRQTETKITALYERLSRDDESAGDSNSIINQNAVQREYLPLLSAILMADGMIDHPLQSVIRKGKSHYVCDERLERRLEQVNLAKKNQAAAEALLSLREWLDADEAVHLSAYDRERICVPQVCDCQRDNCRYRTFLDTCDTGRFPFQICNHNLLLADAIHRNTGRSPIPSMRLTSCPKRPGRCLG